MNLECNQVVELLPDRKAGTRSNWLWRRLGVQIIARDRASACAAGGRDRAPAAVQVADRWHMLRNLGGAVRRAVERRQGAARQAASELAVTQPTAEVSLNSATTEQLVMAAPASEAPIQTKRQADLAEATRLSQASPSIGRIARLLGDNLSVFHQRMSRPFAALALAGPRRWTLRQAAAAAGAHALVVLDGAGWRQTGGRWSCRAT